MESLNRRVFLVLWTLAPLVPAAPGQAPEQRRQPPAAEYIKRLEDPHRVERLKPDAVLAVLQVKPGWVVADIGSGSGLFARPLARAVGAAGRVYAVDVDPELLQHVARTAAEQKLENITTVLGAADAPGLPAGSVDLAFICDTLHHIENRESYLAAVRTILKPDGRVAIIDFSTGWPNGHESMRYSLQDLARWSADAGLVKVSEHDTVPGNYFHVYRAK